MTQDVHPTVRHPHPLLEHAEAIHLAAAAVTTWAEARQSRVMIVKGPALEYHGLRMGHSAADIDALSDRRGYSGLVQSAEKCGWAPRPQTVGDTLTTHHSLTLINPDWPIDIDLHHEFPGLLAGPDRAFEVLWEHREQLVLGGFACWIPDRLSSIVIWALHCLRGAPTQPRHADELAQLVSTVLPKLTESERHELANRAIELGADEPLRAVQQFAEIVGDELGPQVADSRVAWLGKVAQARELTPWLQVLREAHPRERPRLAMLAVWPSSRDLRLMDEHLVDSPIGRTLSRLRRATRLISRMGGRHE